jgi:hypothetical protein
MLPWLLSTIGQQLRRRRYYEWSHGVSRTAVFGDLAHHRANNFEHLRSFRVTKPPLGDTGGFPMDRSWARTSMETGVKIVEPMAARATTLAPIDPADIEW